MDGQKTVIAFKGFDKDLKCNGFQYEVGKEYELPADGKQPIACEYGFHACENPIDALLFYFINQSCEISRFCKVEQSGMMSVDVRNIKTASSKIRILEEMTVEQFVKCCANYVYERYLNNVTSFVSEYDETTEKFSSILSDEGMKQTNVVLKTSFASAYISGFSSTAYLRNIRDFVESTGSYQKIVMDFERQEVNTSGGFATVCSTGFYPKIKSSGDNARIVTAGYKPEIHSSGNFAKIAVFDHNAFIESTGYESMIYVAGHSSRIRVSGSCTKVNVVGERAEIVCLGKHCKVKATIGSKITLVEWYEAKNAPVSIKTEIVDGERIKAGVWHIIRNGKFE